MVEKCLTNLCCRLFPAFKTLADNSRRSSRHFEAVDMIHNESSVDAEHLKEERYVASAISSGRLPQYHGP